MAVHKSVSQSDQNVIVCVWSSENTNMAFLRHIVDQDYNRRCNDQIFLSCPSIFFFITPFSYLPRLRDFYISLHRGCVESRSPWCNLLLGLSSVYFGPSACFCQTPFLVLRLCLCLGIHHIPFGSDTGEIINKVFNLRFKGNSKVIAEHGLDCVVLGKQWYICVSDKPQRAGTCSVSMTGTCSANADCAYYELHSKSCWSLRLKNKLSWLHPPSSLILECQGHSGPVLFFKETLSHTGVMRDLISLRRVSAMACITVGVDQLLDTDSQSMYDFYSFGNWICSQAKLNRWCWSWQEASE